MTSDHGEDGAGVVFFFEMMTGFSAKPESAYFAGGTKTCGFFALPGIDVYRWQKMWYTVYVNKQLSRRQPADKQCPGFQRRSETGGMPAKQ